MICEGQRPLRQINLQQGCILRVNFSCKGSDRIEAASQIGPPQGMLSKGCRNTAQPWERPRGCSLPRPSIETPIQNSRLVPRGIQLTLVNGVRQGHYRVTATDLNQRQGAQQGVPTWLVCQPWQQQFSRGCDRLPSPRPDLCQRRNVESVAEDTCFTRNNAGGITLDPGKRCR